MSGPKAAGEVEARIAEAERDGLRLAIKGRTLALIPVFLWLTLGYNWPGNLYGGLIVGAFIALGVWHYLLIGSCRERLWHRYAFIGIDVLALAALAAFMPLSTAGDVPQIIAFRAYGTTYLILVLAVAALSLSPGLVLWTGAVAVAGLWAAFGWVVAGMERRLSWSDLPPGPSAEEYLAVFLDPDFIGIGNRIEESLVILLAAGVLAVAVRRARSLVRDHAKAERQKAEVAGLFSRFVPVEVVDRIVAERGVLEPATRPVGATGLRGRSAPVEIYALADPAGAAAEG